jgi:predicted metal-dependent hydrolase
MGERTEQLHHNGGIITYTVRPSLRARRTSLTVFRDGRVRVSVPMRKAHSDVSSLVVKYADWILAKLEKYKDSLPPLKGTRKEYVALKEQARARALERLEYFNAHYHFPYKRVAIKNMETRWGSCSARGNLNFHYKLAVLPQHLADYLVVHELCHVKEMNHSARFWALVAKTIPDYAHIRRELKRFKMV